MAQPRYDVLGIGNAIVDVIARAEDDFLVAQGMHKGGMALIDEARAATTSSVAHSRMTSTRPMSPSTSSRPRTVPRPRAATSW
jgi:hypothetical protein